MSNDTIAPDLTEDAVARLASARDPRIRAVSESLIQHLHAFVRDVKPSLPEWFAAIEFLTRTGQMCSDVRQEFILLSDVLGVSMLVELINHHHAENVTSNTILGPFFVSGQPILPMGASIQRRSEPGEPLLIQGLVHDAAGAPVEGARIDVWQTAANGLYDVQDPEAPPGHLRGGFLTGADGRYAVRTVRPASYPIPDDGTVGKWLKAVGRHPWRPAHTHFMIQKDGFETLTTHFFVSPDAYLESDAVFAVRPELIVTPVAGAEGLQVLYDFGLRAVG